MLQSLFVIILVLGAVQAIAYYRRQPPAARKKMLWRTGLIALSIFLLLMVATGRAHWLLAVIGALLPFLRGLLGVGLQLLPWWLKRRQAPGAETDSQSSHSQNADSQKTTVATSMQFEEARDILGLSNELPPQQLTAQMINDAHRRLIQKMHPDRGGSNYLAAQINRARDVLLSAIKSRS